MKDEHAPNPDATAEDLSPFGAAELPIDRRLKIAVWFLAGAVALTVAYLAWTFAGHTIMKNTQSPSARAVANLSAIVAESPGNANARVKLAEALVANDQLDEAVAQLKAALEIDKENAAALVDLGLISMQRRDWATAEGYWKKLIELIGQSEMSSKDQRLANVYYYLGTTYVETERYEDAVVYLKKSISIKRDSSPTHYMLSVAYARLDLTEMQRQELQIVVAFDPKQAQASYDLALLALKEGDTAQAAELLRVAVDNAPDGVTQPGTELAKLGTSAQHLTEATRLKTSDPAKALSEARIAAALDPTNADAVRLVAQLAEQTGDKARALNAWQRLVELVPNDPAALDAIKRLSDSDQ